MTKIYCARWVLPMTSAPVEGGAVIIFAGLLWFALRRQSREA